MMSCGTSSRYGSSLLLKTADFSIQDATAFRAMLEKLPLRMEREHFAGDLLCRLFEGPQHGIAARDRSVERFLGGLLAGKRSFHFLGPDVAHLHHVAKAQAARILGRLLVGELLQRRLQHRVLLIEAIRLGLF